MTSTSPVDPARERTGRAPRTSSAPAERAHAVDEGRRREGDRAGPWRIDLSYAPVRPTVHVRGRVEQRTVVALSDTLHELLATGARELVVDLSDSDDGGALLPLLARTRNELRKRDGSLRLVVGTALPDLLVTLANAPLEQIFLVYEAVRHETRPDSSPDEGPGEAW